MLGCESTQLSYGCHMNDRGPGFCCWALKLISLPKFQSKHQMQWNILNWIFKTLIHQENIILSSRMYEKTYLHGFLEGVLEAIQVSSL